MSEQGGEIGAFMAGFVVGGLVGAAAALIMAPQSGEETRAQIAAKGEEWRHYGEEHLQEYRDLAETTVGDMQERARIVLDEGKARVSKQHEDEAEADEASDGTEIAEDVDEGDAAE